MWLTVGPKWFVDADHVPKSVVQFLTDFVEEQYPRYRYYQEELAFYDKHREMWKDAPFPPTFNTADCAMIAVRNKTPHIAIVRRARAPGKGFHALPGGYVEQDETTYQAAKRENHEEAGVVLSDKQFITDFNEDNPRRSRRGRIFTRVFIFDVSNQDGTLPILKAGDDAGGVDWWTEDVLDDLKHNMFEDHYSLAKKALLQFNRLKGFKL